MDIGKLLLLGGAAFVGYKYFMEPTAIPVSTAPGGIQPAATPSLPATNPTTTRGLILGEAAKQNYTATSTLNADQWNWFYRKARGVDSPADPGLFGESRGPNMTFDEYYTWASQHGLSGYRGVGYVPTSRLMVMEME